MQRTSLIDSDKAKAAFGSQRSLFVSAGAMVANVGPTRLRRLLEERASEDRSHDRQLRSISHDDSSHGCIRPSQDAASSAPPLRHMVGVDVSSSRYRHHVGVRGLGEGLVAVGIESADTTSDGFCITTLMLHRNGYRTRTSVTTTTGKDSR
jgi:hypothetical protein